MSSGLINTAQMKMLRGPMNDRARGQRGGARSCGCFELHRRSHSHVTEVAPSQNYLDGDMVTILRHYWEHFMNEDTTDSR
jgi:hypothetical protein